ncbi:MAG: hypothetical protein EOO88_55680, partial [Pedobacter sp.]
MRKIKGLSLLFLASSLLILSCTKEGPEGPAGAPGAPGAAGPAGAPGAGQTTYSPWFTTTAADWVLDIDPPYWSIWKFKKTAPAVTQAIIDNGVFLSYMKNWTFEDTVTLDPVKEPNKVVQLPYMVDMFLLDYYDYAIPSPGVIDYLYKSQNPWGNDAIEGTMFRYVVIPGSTAGGRSPNGAPT